MISPIVYGIRSPNISTVFAWLTRKGFNPEPRRVSYPSIMRPAEFVSVAVSSNPLVWTRHSWTMPEFVPTTERAEIVPSKSGRAFLVRVIPSTPQVR